MEEYQTVNGLAYVRSLIARVQETELSNRQETALLIYSLAQKYRLQQEALQAARAMLKYPMNIADLDDMDKLDIMSGASLYELWKYHNEAWAIFKSDRAAAMRKSCTNCSRIPRWFVVDYIASIGDAPNPFDHFEFNTGALARHMGDEGLLAACECNSIPGSTVRNYWEALGSVIDSSLEKAASALSLVEEGEDSQARGDSTTSVPQPLDVPYADLIIRSSDLVKFRVHKSPLAMSSPFFRDLLSLPQPSDTESIDGIPVVQMAEDAELLHTLVSMLYPVPHVAPNSYIKVLNLLAACQKYEMEHIQATIRDEVSHGAFPAPVGTEVFCAYAIARTKGLIPEMEKAASLTLDYPMTFETLGEGLRLFSGSALRDLARFRKRCRENLATCLESSLIAEAPGPLDIWAGCQEAKPEDNWELWFQSVAPVPNWLRQIISRNSDLEQKVFTHPLVTPSNIRGEYLTAIERHGCSGCSSCFRVHIIKGSTFCAELENKLARALGDVHASFLGFEAVADGRPVGIGNVSDTAM